MELCRSLGADLVLERSPSDWLAEAMAAVPDGFDTILDVVGGEEIDRNLQAVAMKGRIIQVGLMGGRHRAGQRRRADGSAGDVGRHDAARPPNRGEGRR